MHFPASFSLGLARLATRLPLSRPKLAIGAKVEARTPQSSVILYSIINESVIWNSNAATPTSDPSFNGTMVDIVVEKHISP